MDEEDEFLDEEEVEEPDEIEPVPLGDDEDFEDGPAEEPSDEGADGDSDDDTGEVDGPAAADPSGGQESDEDSRPNDEEVPPADPLRTRQNRDQAEPETEDPLRAEGALASDPPASAASGTERPDSLRSEQGGVAEPVDPTQGPRQPGTFELPEDEEPDPNAPARDQRLIDYLIPPAEAFGERDGKSRKPATDSAGEPLRFKGFTDEFHSTAKEIKDAHPNLFTGADGDLKNSREDRAAADRLAYTAALKTLGPEGVEKYYKDAAFARGVNKQFLTAAQDQEWGTDNFRGWTTRRKETESRLKANLSGFHAADSVPGLRPVERTTAEGETTKGFVSPHLSGFKDYLKEQGLEADFKGMTVGDRRSMLSAWTGTLDSSAAKAAKRDLQSVLFKGLPEVKDPLTSEVAPKAAAKAPAEDGLISSVGSFLGDTGKRAAEQIATAVPALTSALVSTAGSVVGAFGADGAQKAFQDAADWYGSKVKSAETAVSDTLGARSPAGKARDEKVAKDFADIERSLGPALDASGATQGQRWAAGFVKGAAVAAQNPAWAVEQVVSSLGAMGVGRVAATKTAGLILSESQAAAAGTTAALGVGLAGQVDSGRKALEEFDKVPERVFAQSEWAQAKFKSDPNLTATEVRDQARSYVQSTGVALGAAGFVAGYKLGGAEKAVATGSLNPLRGGVGRAAATEGLGEAIEEGAAKAGELAAETLPANTDALRGIGSSISDTRTAAAAGAGGVLGVVSGGGLSAAANLRTPTLAPAEPESEFKAEIIQEGSEPEPAKVVEPAKDLLRLSPPRAPAILLGDEDLLDASVNARRGAAPYSPSTPDALVDEAVATAGLEDDAALDARNADELRRDLAGTSPTINTGALSEADTVRAASREEVQTLEDDARGAVLEAVGKRRGKARASAESVALSAVQDAKSGVPLTDNRGSVYRQAYEAYASARTSRTRVQESELSRVAEEAEEINPRDPFVPSKDSEPVASAPEPVASAPETVASAPEPVASAPAKFEDTTPSEPASPDPLRAPTLTKGPSAIDAMRAIANRNAKATPTGADSLRRRPVVAPSARTPEPVADYELDAARMTLDGASQSDVRQRLVEGGVPAAVARTIANQMARGDHPAWRALTDPDAKSKYAKPVDTNDGLYTSSANLQKVYTAEAREHLDNTGSFADTRDMLTSRGADPDMVRSILEALAVDNPSIAASDENQRAAPQNPARRRAMRLFRSGTSTKDMPRLLEKAGFSTEETDDAIEWVRKNSVSPIWGDYTTVQVEETTEAIIMGQGERFKYKGLVSRAQLLVKVPPDVPTAVLVSTAPLSGDTVRATYLSSDGRTFTTLLPTELVSRSNALYNPNSMEEVGPKRGAISPTGFVLLNRGPGMANRDNHRAIASVLGHEVVHAKLAEFRRSDVGLSKAESLLTDADVALNRLLHIPFSQFYSLSGLGVYRTAGADPSLAPYEAYLRGYLEGGLTTRQILAGLAEENLAHGLQLWITGQLEGVIGRPVPPRIEAFYRSVVPGYKALREEYAASVKGTAWEVGQFTDTVGHPDVLSDEDFADLDAGDTSPRALFAGPNARTSDIGQATLRIAKQQLERGRKPEQVLRQTGWFVGSDGKWRFEIDDSKATFTAPTVTTKPSWLRRLFGEKPRTSEVSHARVKLSSVLSHPTLYKAYPTLANASITLVRSDNAQGGSTVFRVTRDAGFSGKEALVFTGFTVQYSNNKDALDTILHEVQHYIQHKEGFARGSNVNQSEVPPEIRASPKGHRSRIYTSPSFEKVTDVTQLVEAEELALRYAELADLTSPTPAETAEAGAILDKMQAALYTTAATYSAAMGEIEAERVVERRTLGLDARRQTPLPADPNARRVSGTFSTVAESVLAGAQVSAAAKARREAPVEVGSIGKKDLVRTIDGLRTQYALGGTLMLQGVERGTRDLGAATIELDVQNDAFFKLPLTQQLELVRAAEQDASARHNVPAKMNTSAIEDQGSTKPGDALDKFWKAYNPYAMPPAALVMDKLEARVKYVYGEDVTVEPGDPDSVEAYYEGEFLGSVRVLDVAPELFAQYGDGSLSVAGPAARDRAAREFNDRYWAAYPDSRPPGVSANAQRPTAATPLTRQAAEAVANRVMAAIGPSLIKHGVDARVRFDIKPDVQGRTYATHIKVDGPIATVTVNLARNGSEQDLYNQLYGKVLGNFMLHQVIDDANARAAGIDKEKAFDAMASAAMKYPKLRAHWEGIVRSYQANGFDPGTAAMQATFIADMAAMTDPGRKSIWSALADMLGLVLPGFRTMDWADIRDIYNNSLEAKVARQLHAAGVEGAMGATQKRFRRVRAWLGEDNSLAGNLAVTLNNDAPLWVLLDNAMRDGRDAQSTSVLNRALTHFQSAKDLFSRRARGVEYMKEELDAAVEKYAETLPEYATDVAAARNMATAKIEATLAMMTSAERIEARWLLEAELTSAGARLRTETIDSAREAATSTADPEARRQLGATTRQRLTDVVNNNLVPNSIMALDRMRYAGHSVADFTVATNILSSEPLLAAAVSKARAIVGHTADLRRAVGRLDPMVESFYGFQYYVPAKGGSPEEVSASFVSMDHGPGYKIDQPVVLMAMTGRTTPMHGVLGELKLDLDRAVKDTVYNETARHLGLVARQLPQFFFHKGKNAAGAPAPARVMKSVTFDASGKNAPFFEDTDFTKVAAANNALVYYDARSGRRYEVAPKVKEIIEPFTTAVDQSLPVVEKARAVTRGVGALYTKLRPAFWLASAARDGTHMAALSATRVGGAMNGVKALARYGTHLANPVRNAALWKFFTEPDGAKQEATIAEWRASGKYPGVVMRYERGNIQSFNAQFSASGRDRFLRNNTQAASSRAPDVLRTTGRSVFNLVDRVGEYTDNVFRQAFFDTLISAKVDPDVALQQTRLTMNWANRSAAAHAMSVAWAFSNPRLAGGYQMLFSDMFAGGRAPLRSVPNPTSQGGVRLEVDYPRALKEFNYGLAALYIAGGYATIMYATGGGGDEEKLKQVKKSLPLDKMLSHAIIGVGPDGTVYGSPFQFGVQHVLMGSGQLVGALHSGLITEKEWRKGMVDIARSETPVGPPVSRVPNEAGDQTARAVALQVMPTALQGMASVLMNANVFGGTVAPDNAFGKKYKSDSSFPNTETIFKQAATGLREVTGVDLHPEQIKQVVSSAGVVYDAVSVGAHMAGVGKPNETAGEVAARVTGTGRFVDSKTHTYHEAREAKGNRELALSHVRAANHYKERNLPVPPDIAAKATTANRILGQQASEGTRINKEQRAGNLEAADALRKERTKKFNRAVDELRAR